MTARRALLTNRAIAPSVALETTLLVHGVPRDHALPLHTSLEAAVRAGGAHPALVGLVMGSPIVGMTPAELELLLAAPSVAKANTSNLGVLMHRKAHGATTVSTTIELAAKAGIRIFSTGGIGGVHRGYGVKLDVSSDLVALSRFPVAVVSSGVKSILDVESTREALETLGVPVIGFRTDRFPAFYLRESGASVDARFDDEHDLAMFVHDQLSATGRGVLIVNPIPAADAIDAGRFAGWLATAERQAHESGAQGRGVTPAILSSLHEVSGGETLRANIALAVSNAELAGRIAGAA